MSNGRLDRWKRSAIIDCALKHAFSERRDIITKQEHVLGLECYNQSIPQETRDLIKKLPPDWLFHRNTCRFNVAGYTIDFYFGLHGVPVPYGGDYMLGTIKFGELADRVMKFLGVKEQLEKEEKELRNNLRGLINSVSTINQLKAIWPEGEQFYSCYAIKQTTKAALPAIPFDKINAAWRIPLAA